MTYRLPMAPPRRPASRSLAGNCRVRCCWFDKLDEVLIALRWLLIAVFATLRYWCVLLLYAGAGVRHKKFWRFYFIFSLDYKRGDFAAFDLLTTVRHGRRPRAASATARASWVVDAARHALWLHITGTTSHDVNRFTYRHHAHYNFNADDTWWFCSWAMIYRLFWVLLHIGFMQPRASLKIASPRFFFFYCVFSWRYFLASAFHATPHVGPLAPLAFTHD
jgi:hypothetical protein